MNMNKFSKFLPKQPGGIAAVETIVEVEQKGQEPKARFGAQVIPLPMLVTGAPFIQDLPREDGGIDYNVYIYGVIGGMTMGCVDLYSDLIQLLDTAKQDTSFTFYICSGGGQVHEATQIASAMKRTAAGVTTKAVGPCCSAAVVIWMAGKVRTISDGSYLMQHMSSHTDWGDSAALGLLSNSLVKWVIDGVLKPMMDEGLLTEEEFVDITDRRKSIWLDAATVRERLGIGE